MPNGVRAVETNCGRISLLSSTQARRSLQWREDCNDARQVIAGDRGITQWVLLRCAQMAAKPNRKDAASLPVVVV